MAWQRTFFIVTGCALIGMMLGGLFGYAAGSIAPSFFRIFAPWPDVEPAGIATFFGATAGVMLGGGLGCFGILMQVIVDGRRQLPKA
jgi:hypothetical protein